MDCVVHAARLWRLALFLAVLTCTRRRRKNSFDFRNGSRVSRQIVRTSADRDSNNHLPNLPRHGQLSFDERIRAAVLGCVHSHCGADFEWRLTEAVASLRAYRRHRSAEQAFHAVLWTCNGDRAAYFDGYAIF